MARRDFRQFGLADSIVQRRGKKTAWLERLDAAIDWADLEAIVAGIYASREGGLAYPLLTYVKLLLLQQWYGLSDEGLEAAVDDRLSFRRFAGIPLAESVPDHGSVWRAYIRYKSLSMWFRSDPQPQPTVGRHVGAARRGGARSSRGRFGGGSTTTAS